MFVNFLQLTFTWKSTRNTQNNSLNLLRTDPRGPRELLEGPQGTPGTFVALRRSVAWLESGIKEKCNEFCC